MKSRFQQSIRYYTPLLLLFFSLMANGQQPGNWQQGNRPAGANRQDMNIGRMYGKVVDEQGKGMGYVTVQLVGMKFDTVTKTRQEALISGQITEDNGDFNLEGLPIMGKFTSDMLKKIWKYRSVSKGLKMDNVRTFRRTS